MVAMVVTMVVVGMVETMGEVVTVAVAVVVSMVMVGMAMEAMEEDMVVTVPQRRKKLRRKRAIEFTVQHWMINSVRISNDDSNTVVKCPMS